MIQSKNPPGLSFSLMKQRQHCLMDGCNKEEGTQALWFDCEMSPQAHVLSICLPAGGTILGVSVNVRK